MVFQGLGKPGAQKSKKIIRNVSAMYPQCMLFDTVGVLLNDFINQTLGSTFESICCDVQFADLSGMPWGKDLLEGGTEWRGWEEGANQLPFLGGRI